MTQKQSAFVDQYLVDGDATQAAIRAGYSEKAARSAGRRNLGDSEVVALIEACRGARGGATSETPPALEATPSPEAPRPSAVRPELTEPWVLETLREIVERCMREVPVRDRAGNETGEWTFKAREALSALGLLGKHLGMFTGRLDVRVLRDQAEAVAAEYDLDADEVLAEARRWLERRA